MQQLRTAVIGTGYLGQFHAEKFANLPQSKLVAVCDIDQARVSSIAAKFGVEAISNFQSLLNKVDAVSIVTPTPLHFEIAKFFISNNVHVLIEKPITLTLEEAETLTNLSKIYPALIQVGHIEQFNNAFLEVQQYIDNPLFIQSSRLTQFKQRGTDVNVVLDLMIHDIELIQSIVKAPIIKIDPCGYALKTKQIDTANVNLQFANGCKANLTASRMHFENERKLSVWQNERLLHVDLQHKKLFIDTVTSSNSKIIECEPGDALKTQIEHFLNAILENKKPKVGPLQATQALQTALEITHLIAHPQLQAVYA